MYLSALLFYRRPAKKLEINRFILPESHPLFFQEGFLQFITVSARQRNLSLDVDDPKPGKFFFLGGGVKNADDLTGASWVAGLRGYLPVGGHFATRYFFYELDCPFAETVAHLSLML